MARTNSLDLAFAPTLAPAIPFIITNIFPMVEIGLVGRRHRPDSSHGRPEGCPAPAPTHFSLDPAASPAGSSAPHASVILGPVTGDADSH